MASTVNLTLKKSGYVKSGSANTVFRTNTSTWYLIDTQPETSMLVLGFDAMPSALRRKRILSARLRAAVKVDGSGSGYFAYPNAADFDPATLTYNNMPARSGSISLQMYLSAAGTADVWSKTDAPDSTAAALAQYGCQFHTYHDSISTVYAKTALVSGGLPYLEVTYDESSTITSKVGNLAKSPSGTQNPGLAAQFTWGFLPDGGRCADESWTQASATFYWKTSAESSWHSVAVSGATKGVTIPATTFPPSSTIQCYVRATDTEGTTTQSDTMTFTTSEVYLTVYNLPSGSNIDTRSARTLTWTLKADSYDYPQTAATYYWRKTGESTWHTISVSGNTKSLTIPANTLPTGATVEQYFSCTPQGTAAISLNTSTFTTPTTKITALTYPSGRDVESGGPLRFSWAFRNALGDYDQSSARLYWRASTSDPYQTIEASGTEKSLTVPKNTFPGNASTISWYLEGTDVGGTTSTTSEQNFTTVKSQITPQDCPTSGYADPRNAITFAWYFATPTASYDQASAVFHWHVKGTEAWTDVAASGSTGSVTIPANTFPVASEIEWYVSGTDVGGCSSQSETYTISTTASTAYAICVSPVGRVEDGTKAITFRWMVQNSDGSAPKRMLLWWKLPTESASQWHQLLNTTSEVYEYTVPEGTFEAGPVQWRVQAYNRDSVAGPISEASFVVLRAPEPPEGLTATAVPLTTISWQSDGQGAYEITIDGKIVAAEYGPSVYSWTVPEPLEDGVHSILVRIQGSYGLWSNYAETSIAVENSDSSTLVLSGEFGTDAVLSLNYRTASPIRWYRDGKLIAVVSTKDGTGATLTTYTDRLAIGSHEYFARVFRTTGNYAQSNTVTGEMDVRYPMIAALSGGPWISLRLSENRNREQIFTWSMESGSTHIHGRTYPALELSPYENLTGSFDCAFRSAEEAAAFEALRGKVVILKSRGGQLMVGGLTRLQKKVKRFYTAYTFSLEQTDWEDFTDDAENS